MTRIRIQYLESVLDSLTWSAGKLSESEIAKWLSQKYIVSKDVVREKNQTNTTKLTRVHLLKLSRN